MAEKIPKKPNPELGFEWGRGLPDRVKEHPFIPEHDIYLVPTDAPAAPTDDIEGLARRCREFDSTKHDAWAVLEEAAAALRTLKAERDRAVSNEQLWRDCFEEITAKAAPYGSGPPDDPDRIMAYLIPAGPIHRAAGKTSCQAFGLYERLRTLEAERDDGELLPRLVTDLHNRELERDCATDAPAASPPPDEIEELARRLETGISPWPQAKAAAALRTLKAERDRFAAAAVEGASLRNVAECRATDAEAHIRAAEARIAELEEERVAPAASTDPMRHLNPIPLDKEPK